MRIENPVTAALFLSLALIGGTDFVLTHPAISNGLVTDKSTVYPSLYDQRSLPHSDLTVQAQDGSVTRIRTDLKTARELSIGDTLSTETSVIFQRTTVLKFDGKTRVTLFASYGIAVLLASLGALVLSIGSLSLKFSEKSA